MKISIVCKQDAFSNQIKSKLKTSILKKGHSYDEDHPDLVFTVGGDGTFLYAVNKYLALIDTVNFVPIHTGTLGFIAEFTAEDIEECLSAFDSQKYSKLYKFPLLECELDDGQKFYAVNDIRVESMVLAQTIEVYINDLYFEKFRGNGILVCTQLGSTAYNRSLNGAVIDAGLRCIEMTEIAGLSHQNTRSCRSSIIFNSNTKIVLKNDNYNNVSLIYDFKEFKLTNQKSLVIKESSKYVKMISVKNIPYLTRIKYLF